MVINSDLYPMQAAKTSHSASWITKVILASLVFLSALTCFVDRPSSGEPYRPAKELTTSAGRGQKITIAFRWNNQLPSLVCHSDNCNQLTLIQWHTRLVQTRLRAIRTALANRFIPPGFSPLQVPGNYTQELPAHS